MNREWVLKVVMGLVGLLFLASGFLVVTFARQEPALAMLFSVYFTLGIFLLLAIRNPWENRTLIAFTAWSSLVHAGVMGFQAFRNMIAHGELIGVAVFAVVAVALLALRPGNQAERPGMRQWLENTQEAKPISGGSTAAQTIRELRGEE